MLLFIYVILLQNYAFFHCKIKCVLENKVFHEKHGGFAFEADFAVLMAVSGKVTYNISWKEEDASSENLVEPNATNFEMCLTVPYLEGFGSSKNGRGPMIEDFSKYYVYIENDFRIHRRGSLGEELTNRATPDLVKSGHDMQLASVHISDQGHFQVNFTGVSYCYNLPRFLLSPPKEKLI